jgi:hypothetical protein
MSNHHPDYKRWCLALWIARDLPRDMRRENADTPGFKYIGDKQLRRSWFERYEKRRGGPDLVLKGLVTELYRTLTAGGTPEYTGPFQAGGRVRKEVAKPDPFEVQSDPQPDLFGG